MMKEEYSSETCEKTDEAGIFDDGNNNDDVCSGKNQDSKISEVMQYNGKKSTSTKISIDQYDDLISKSSITSVKMKRRKKLQKKQGKLIKGYNSLEISRKKRYTLKGMDLINTILKDPILSTYTELLDTSIDDLTRKRLIRQTQNKICAQKTRNAKKSYIESVEHENNALRNENYQLKAKIEQLEKETKCLNERFIISTQDPVYQSQLSTTQRAYDHYFSLLLSDELKHHHKAYFGFSS